jgi:hypothetical protein
MQLAKFFHKLPYEIKQLPASEYNEMVNVLNIEAFCDDGENNGK